MLNLSSEPGQTWRSLKMRRILIAIIFFLASFAVSADSCLDINTAPKEELEKIKHIGEVRAEQIIKLRKEKSFSSVDELERVAGIGPSRISDIKEQGLACVSSEPAIEVAEVRPQQPIQQPIIYPSGIVINEIMPSPEGADETGEWVEIFNQNNFEADLSGWQLADTTGKTNIYTFPAGIKISALGFLVLGRPETKIILNNDSDGLNFIQPDGKIADSVSYEKAPQSQSFYLTKSGWVWSKNPTPGAVSRDPISGKTSIKEIKKGEKGIEKGLAAVSEPAITGQNRRNFYPFLAALTLAISSGFVILFLKYKIKI